MRISDWSSDVCSSDLIAEARVVIHRLDDAASGLAAPDGSGIAATLKSLDSAAQEIEQLAGQLRRTPRKEALPMKTISARSEEHTSELQSLMRTSYAVFCFKHKNYILYILFLHY